METRTGPILVALGIVIGSLSAPPVASQPSEVTIRGVVEGDIVEGLVSRTDPRARTITLDNGQEYLVPRALGVDWEAVRPGVAVRLRYSVAGGQSIATAIQVRS
jgi:hypothetical protein